MMTSDTDLSELHNRWLQRLTEVEAGGTDPDSAAESMLTIALTGLMRVHGPRYVAQRLVIVSGMMAALAEKNAVDGRTDPKTRH